MPETQQAYVRRFTVTSAMAALLFCSILPIWGIIRFSKICGLGHNTTFWHMLVLGWPDDSPDGSWAVRREWTEGAIITSVVVAITYFAARWYAKCNHPNFR